jgi:hypothetical protein
LDRAKRATSRGHCEHDAFPVEVLTVGGGRKKIARCLGCGRSGPVCESSAEALAALRARGAAEVGHRRLRWVVVAEPPRRAALEA